MKKFLNNFMAFTLLIVICVPVAVKAHADDGTDTQTEVSSEQAEAELTEEEKASKRQQRLEAAKAERKLSLDKTQIDRLKNRCEAAQTKINGKLSSIKGLTTSRSRVYANLEEHLTSILTKLTEKGTDTTELRAAVNDLSTQINTFNTDLVVLQQSLTDLAEMDCAADPEAFKAVLTQVREDFVELKDLSKAIHTQLKETIKPILQEIRAKLEADKVQPESETAN